MRDERIIRNETTQSSSNPHPVPTDASLEPASGQTWWQRQFPALSHRPFRQFLAGQSVSVIGSWMQQAALGWYVQTLTRAVGSEYWLGLTSAVSSLPIVLLSSLGGALADRRAKRPLLIATQSAAMCTAFGFGLLIWAGAAPMWAVLCFAALWGAILAFDIPTRQAFSVEMVGKHSLLSAIALNSAVFNVGRLLGPMVAGLVIAAVGVAACFVINAVTFVPVLIALCIMQLPRAMPSTDSSALMGSKGPLTGFGIILANRTLLGLLGLLSSVLITGGTYLTLMPALAENSLQLGARGYSVLLAANGLGALVGSLIVIGRGNVESRRSAIVVGIALMASGLIALSFARSVWLACPALVVVGAGFVVFLASTNSTVQLSVSDEVRGRVMGVWVLVFGASQPIGSYAAGHIASWIGTPRTFFWEGSACLIAACAAFYLLSRSKASA